MCEAFVGGDKFHGFNLNGHTYYAIDEWIQLWKYLGHVMTPLSESDAGEPAMAEPRDVQADHSRRYGISDRGVDFHGQGAAEFGFRISVAQRTGQCDANSFSHH